jgi:hypothetical protein
VPNRGSEQAALLAIGMHAQQIQELLNKLPFGSDAASTISEAINKIRKHVPPTGAVAPGVERAQLDSMQAAQRQNAMRMAMLRQQAAAGAPGAGGGIPARPPAQLMQPSMGM